MNKNPKNIQFGSSPFQAPGQRHPRLEEIRRVLFPRLIENEVAGPSHPRFADLLDRFAARRP